MTDERARVQAHLDQIAACNNAGEKVTVSETELAILVTMGYIGALHEAGMNTPDPEVRRGLAAKIANLHNHPELTCRELVNAFTALITQERFDKYRLL